MSLPPAMCGAGEVPAVAHNDVDPASARSESSGLPRSEAAASGGLTGHTGAASENPGSGLLAEIKRLRDTQKDLKGQRKKLSKDMKNAMKKKKRLHSKACQLTDADIVEVLHMRQTKASETASSSEVASSRAEAADPGARTS